ncbi:TIGR02453 family protein [Rhodobacterales bacterium HKCCE2091]|nr:TIGR02453 family protein [Rhodobacterales bacterium HKCCE2091]
MTGGDYTDLVDRAQPFFAALDANNDREWFEPRKAEFAETIRDPGAAFAAEMADRLSALTGTALSEKVFRIHRDVRFSKDKRPYKAHLHMLWANDAEAHMPLFFGIEPDRLRFGTGLFRMDGPLLARFREMVDREGAALGAEIERLAADHGAALSDMGSEALKKVPKPYAADHPQGDLLRRKSFGVFADLPADWRNAGLVASTEAMARAFMPLWRLVAAAL